MKKAIMFIESEISNSLLTAGLPANLQGFQFLREAIMETLKHPELLQQLTKKLYPTIAALHKVNTAVVERSMRHVIDVAYKTQGLYGINELLSAPVFSANEKPCNGNLIALITEIVRRNLYKMVATSSDADAGERAQLIKEIQEFLELYYGDRP